jgi:hypothetical protein
VDQAAGACQRERGFCPCKGSFGSLTLAGLTEEKADVGIEGGGGFQDELPDFASDFGWEGKEVAFRGMALNLIKGYTIEIKLFKWGEQKATYAHRDGLKEVGQCSAHGTKYHGIPMVPKLRYLPQQLLWYTMVPHNILTVRLANKGNIKNTVQTHQILVHRRRQDQAYL